MGNAAVTGNIETRSLTAPASGRIDAVLAGAFEDLSRVRVQRLIDAGHARVNGSPARKAMNVSEGDALELEVPAAPHESVPTGLELPVLYEDDQLCVIDKPAGLAVHGAPGDTGPSVAAWWLEKLGEAAGAFDVERPGIVHRLDKDTSGVLVLARTPAAQAALSRAPNRVLGEHHEPSIQISPRVLVADYHDDLRGDAAADRGIAIVHDQCGGQQMAAEYHPA